MMKLPDSVEIPRDKLTRYLLVRQTKNDKSRLLEKIGYTQENPDALEMAIRRMIREYDAVQDREDEYGTFYRVTGTLYGTAGHLEVITIWVYRAKDEEYQFITLKPNRE